MKSLNQQTVKRVVSMGLALAATLAFSSANAAFYDPYTGLWMSNICQSTYGWSYINTRPVGERCYVPGYGYGIVI